MHQNLRAALSFVVAAIVNEREYSSIYDFLRGQHILISGEITNGSISIYDHEISAHVSGEYSQGTCSLYHHGFGCHISLEWEGVDFQGFVHGNGGGHFSGSVRDDGLSFYDFSTSQHYHFSVN